MLTENSLAFCKRLATSDDLTSVADRANGLPASLAHRKSAAHIASCDFCGTEAQPLRQEGFLVVNEVAPPPLPFALLVLAISLLPEPASSRAALHRMG